MIQFKQIIVDAQNEQDAFVKLNLMLNELCIFDEDVLGVNIIKIQEQPVGSFGNTEEIRHTICVSYKTQQMSYFPLRIRYKDGDEEYVVNTPSHIRSGRDFVVLETKVPHVRTR